MSASEDITRQILGNVPPLLQRGAFISPLAWHVPWQESVRAPYAALSAWATPGVAEQPRRSWWRSIVALLSYVTFHQQLLRDRYAGIAHLLMFYGFSVLFIGTCLVFLEHDTRCTFYGTFYLVASLGIDLGGVAFIVGLVMFLARRLRGSAPRQAWWVAAWPGYSWPSG